MMMQGRRRGHVCARCSQPVPGPHRSLFWDELSKWLAQQHESVQYDDSQDQCRNCYATPQRQQHVLRQWAHRMSVVYLPDSDDEQQSAAWANEDRAPARNYQPAEDVKPWDLHVIGDGIKILEYKVIDDMHTPDTYKCPISCEIMQDPLVASDGYSYEADMLKDLFFSCKGKDCVPSPVNRTSLMPYAFHNIALNQIIQEWVAGNPNFVQIVS